MLPDTWRDRWQTLASRERRAVILLAGFLLLALMTQIGWTLRESIERLRQRVPELEQQAARMRAMEFRLRAIRERPLLAAAGGASGVQLVDRVRDVARGRLPVLPATAMVAEGSHAVRLRIDMPFDVWPGLVADIQRELGLRLVACDVVLLTAGIVRIDASFLDVRAGP